MSILNNNDTINIAYLYFEKQKTLKEISEQYNVSVNTIKRNLILNYPEKYKKASERNYKNLNIDHKFFEVIDTEEKAYLLGYLLADGNVYFSDSYKLRFCLAYQDINILYKFKEILHLNSKILTIKRKNRKNSQMECSLSWTSEGQFKDVAKYGIVPNKTLVSFLPIDKIDENVIHHFIRGFFDGDGCISVKGNKHALSFVGTYELITQLRKYLCDKLDIYFVKLSYRTKKNTVYQIMWSSKKDIRKLFEFLYKDATIYLDRKYLKFKEIK